MATQEEPQAEPAREIITIITGDAMPLVLDAAQARLWLTSSFAPDWFKDSAHEAESSGRDARRREIIFAVCCAESYLLEWVRDQVLNQDFERLDIYFPLGDQRPVREKWKEVPKRLQGDDLIRAVPDYGREFWADFVQLVKYRNGLLHARASRPDSPDLSQTARPEPNAEDLGSMQARWATSVVATLIRELHSVTGTVPPAWLDWPRK
jgi:hypothetical protein